MARERALGLVCSFIELRSPWQVPEVFSESEGMH